MAKLNGWRVSEPYSVPKQAEYHQEQAKRMRADPSYKKREIDPALLVKCPYTGKMIDPQTPSTMQMLQAQKEGKVRDWTAPLPDNVLANPNAKNKDELVGMQPRDTNQVLIAEMIRKAEKNTGGESKESATTPGRREKAVHSYIVSPPVKESEIDWDRVKGLVEIVSQPIVEEWKELPWYRAFWHWMTGNKVKQVKK